jgi:hypothetical protein
MNVLKSTVENIDGAITYGQSRETDKQKQNKNTTENVLDSSIYKQTQIT